jgi:hypothetical protein
MHDELTALREQTATALRGLANDWAEGSLGPSDFGDAVASLLEDAHTSAAVLGRMHAGDDAPEDEDDRTFGESVVDGEVEYLGKFVADLEGDRYFDAEDNPRADAVAARAASYASKLTATASEAWGLALPETTLFYWMLGGTEDHCDDCPELARSGPYRIDTIPTWPAAGATQCRVNCLCYVRTAAGAIGFRRETGDTG